MLSPNRMSALCFLIVFSIPLASFSQELPQIIKEDQYKAMTGMDPFGNAVPSMGGATESLLLGLFSAYANAYAQQQKQYEIQQKMENRVKAINTALRLKNYEKGIELSNDAMEEFNSKYFILYRGMSYYLMGDFENAKDDYYEYLSVFPNADDAYIMLANIEHSEGNTEQAYQVLENAIAENGNSEDLCLGKGVIGIELGYYEKSISDFGKVININPNNKEAFIYRGKCHAELGNFKLAKINFNKAIYLNPNTGYLYLLRGETYYSLNNLQKANSDFSTACDLGSKKACERLKN